MADEREATPAKPSDPTAARPAAGLGAAPNSASGEVRSFDPKARSETAPEPASRDTPVSTQEGRLGPGGDPVEGKP